jgi:hypothetical protein
MCYFILLVYKLQTGKVYVHFQVLYCKEVKDFTVFNTLFIDKHIRYCFVSTFTDPKEKVESCSFKKDRL